MSHAANWYDQFFDGLYGQVLGRQFAESQTMQQVRIVRRLLGLRKGQRVLNVPCGQGRLTIPLARQGLLMTGADLTTSYLDKARRRARRNGLDVAFIEADMRNIDFHSCFDTVFNWFGSFGYFSEADNLALCRRIWRALKPGGRFLVEGVNKSFILGHFRSRPAPEMIGGVQVGTENRWDSRSQRCVSTWTFATGESNERDRTSMRIFDGSKIRALLKAAGFRDIRLFGAAGLSGPVTEKLSRHARRWMAIARKPKGLDKPTFSIKVILGQEPHP